MYKYLIQQNYSRSWIASKDWPFLAVLLYKYF